MKLSATHLRRFESRLPVVARNAHRSWQERRGLLLQLVDNQGHIGWGEASPLPGYSIDSYHACFQGLSAIQWPTSLPDTFADASSWVASGAVAEALPAARCAVETALLDLLAQRARQPAWQLLRDVGGFSSPLTALGLAAVVDTVDATQAAAEANRAISLGYRAVKLKVGGLQLERDLDRIGVVLNALEPNARLRLDVNRGWSPVEARYALDRLNFDSLEFVEEPVREGRWTELGPTPVSLAADESLRHPASGDMLATLVDCGVSHVVIKPMALGLRRSIDWATESRAHGLGVVVSHLLDGPVAMAVAASLALAMGSPAPAAGLGRHPGLDAWKGVESIALRGATIVPSDTPGLGLRGTQALSRMGS